MGTTTLLSSNPKIERGSWSRTLVSRMKFFRICWRSDSSRHRSDRTTAGCLHYSHATGADHERRGQKRARLMDGRQSDPEALGGYKYAIFRIVTSISP